MSNCPHDKAFLEKRLYLISFDRSNFTDPRLGLALKITVQAVLRPEMVTRKSRCSSNCYLTIKSNLWASASTSDSAEFCCHDNFY